MAATKKMTWNRLMNDSSISKSELPKIARAFGITVPKGWDTKKGTSTKSSVKGQSRTEGSTKVGPKKATKKTYKKMETPKDEGPVRKKTTTKSKTTTTPTSTRKKYSTPSDAGPEQAYRKTIKRVATGGGTKSSSTKLVPVKARKAASLHTGSKARGQQKYIGKVPLREAGWRSKHTDKPRQQRGGGPGGRR